MLMNIGTVESKHVFTLGESGERNDIHHGKEFQCCMVDGPSVDFVLTPSSINILVEGR